MEGNIWLLVVFAILAVGGAIGVAKQLRERKRRRQRQWPRPDEADSNMEQGAVDIALDIEIKTGIWIAFIVGVLGFVVQLVKLI